MFTQNKLNSSYKKAIGIIAPGRQIANITQSKISYNRYRTFYNRILDKGNEPTTLLDNVFQDSENGKIQQIAVPRMGDLLDVLEKEPAKIYKGVSYNPYTAGMGENINLLDFFSYLKQGKFSGLVVNASAYAVVNTMKLLPVKLYTKESGKDAAKTLRYWFDQCSIIKKSSNSRQDYLEAISLSLMPQKSKPQILDALDIWQSENYQKALLEAIEFCAQPKKELDPIRINRYANYNRYDTEYQRWYSILVVAESIYLKNVFGTNLKLGPTTETNFDKLIKTVMQDRQDDFAFIWYDRSIEKTVPISQRVSFSDNIEQIEKKIESNPDSAKWLQELITPFISTNMDTLSADVSRIVDEVNNAKSKLTKTPFFEGGFYNAFPPGECD